MLVTWLARAFLAWIVASIFLVGVEGGFALPTLILAALLWWGVLRR